MSHSVMTKFVLKLTFPEERSNFHIRHNYGDNLTETWRQTTIEAHSHQLTYMCFGLWKEQGPSRLVGLNPEPSCRCLVRSDGWHGGFSGDCLNNLFDRQCLRSISCFHLADNCRVFWLEFVHFPG